MFSMSDVSTSRRERTRARLREVALRSFRERGYDATTIRLIAHEAGVSVGTTNFHFASKNHLVQELYLDVQHAHRAAAEPRLAGEGADLVARLGIVFRSGLEQLGPYREHATEFLAAAISPRSALNPLSLESAAALAVIEGVFRDAVEGATGVPREFASELPRVLVLAHLLLVLFWVYDTSAGQRRTSLLLDGALGLLRVGLPLSRLPGVRAPLRRMLVLLAEARA